MSDDLFNRSINITMKLIDAIGEQGLREACDKLSASCQGKQLNQAYYMWNFPLKHFCQDRDDYCIVLGTYQVVSLVLG